MSFDKPSTYTPLTRRFTNERNRELRETRELYDQVKVQQDAFTETMLTVGQRVFDELGAIPEPIFHPLAFAMHDLLEGESYIWKLPAPDLERLSLKEYVEHRNLLLHKQHFFANQTEYLDTIHTLLAGILGALAEGLPQMQEPTPFTIPLVAALPNAPRLVEGIFGTLADAEYQDRGIFRPVTDKLYRNLCEASGRDPDSEKSTRPFKYPTDSDLPPSDLVDTYLKGTPFHQVFTAPVPLKLTHQDRFNHTHIIGGTGAGKTTLIERLILFDVIDRETSPSLVVIDPHGDLLKKLMRTGGLDDRLILIDPRDTEFPVALNPLAVNRERLAKYDKATQEQVAAGVIQTFGYLWNGLTNLTLTGKQDVFFRYVTRLLLTMPEVREQNATILDMLNLMSDASQYADVIEKLNPIQREFFERDFRSKTFEGTREQVRYRIQAIIENPTMERLFTAPETKVDFFSELNRGSIILVDTAKDFLKEGSAIFGKLIISLILQAVLERAALPENERKATFLIVDEAGSFFSQNIDDLLTEARKYRCGLVLAHQYLDQASGSLKASLAANTGIKFASGLSAPDAAVMAREMRCSADFILDQPRLQFAAHIRNVTPQAVSVPVPLLRDLPRISDEEYAELLGRNRERVSLPKRLQEPARPSSEQPGEDISPRW